MMRIGLIRHIGLIKIGLIGLIGPILLSGCVSLFVKPYGHVSVDAEKVRPDRRSVYMPDNAPSISQGYKPKRLKKSGSGGHEGIDIIDRSGTPVIAASSGVVTESYFELFFGRRIEIAHGVDEKGRPVMSRYLHLKERLVEKGDVVVRGQRIGTMGRSGILAGGILHLHYEVRVGSGQNNSMNPHRFWADGVGVVTCFDKNRQWDDQPFNTTYPVPCRDDSD
jgi:murein DD-endopeptidase MepM/ murein hydrolase activator NlpD